MKALYSKLGIIGVIIILIFSAYSITYKIVDNKIEIEDNILKFINKPTQRYDYVDIKQDINIDNKKYILYTTTGKIGFAELVKGPNNKYKIAYTEHNNNFINEKVIETNRGKYIVLIGKNPDKEIEYSEVILEFNNYEIKIPDEEYFIVSSKIKDDTQSILIDPNNVKLFDTNGTDISHISFEVDEEF